MSRLVYLDSHATTPVDPRVLEAMLPWFAERFGNAASRSHRFGWEAEEAVEQARGEIAALLGAEARDVIFTSGATESDNLAVKGVVEFHAARGDHVITGATEHKAVLDSCRALEKAGRARVTVLPVDATGRVDPDDVRRAITPGTVLISLMHANNEIGTLHPLAEIGGIARAHGIAFHSDAAQSVGKVPVNVEMLAVDCLAFTAHKFYGPKGVGALWVRGRGPRLRLAPQMHGGGHERGLRSGTLNVPGIVGLGRACAIAAGEMAAEGARLLALRERLWRGLRARLEGLSVNGHPSERLAGNLNVQIPGIEGDSLMAALPDVALSSGSACTSAALEPSPVLRAIGLDEAAAHASIRFGLGRYTTEADIDYAVERVAHEVERLRALSPGWAAQRRAAR